MAAVVDFCYNQRMKTPVLIAEKTLQKIAESPEDFARLFLGSCGTDALEDFIDRIRSIWDREGSHK